MKTGLGPTLFVIFTAEYKIKIYELKCESIEKRM
jgi:hypothetical protein